MKIKTILSLAGGLSLAGAQAFAAPLFNMSDISNWVGTGSNEAALVIDWNDGQDSIAWGFRYDGTASTADMVSAVLAADSDLYSIAASDYTGVTLGYGYDRDGDGFSVDPSLSFDADGVATALSSEADGFSAVDVDDSFAAGWNTGYFGFYTSTDNPFVEGWDYSMVGAGDYTLTDGSWSGFSWAPGFAETTPDSPFGATVPEPSTYAALAGALALGLVAMRRRRA